VTTVQPAAEKQSRSAPSRRTAAPAADVTSATRPSP
jgi:hypothetical protein